MEGAGGILGEFWLPGGVSDLGPPPKTHHCCELVEVGAQVAASQVDVAAHIAHLVTAGGGTQKLGDTERTPQRGGSEAERCWGGGGARNPPNPPKNRDTRTRDGDSATPLGSPSQS